MSTLKFMLEYVTSPRECIALRYSSHADGIFVEMPLASPDGRIWSGTVEREEGKDIRYAYCVKRGDETVRAERDAVRRFLSLHRSRVVLADCWTERDIPSYYFTSAFTQCVMKAENDGMRPAAEQLSGPYLLLVRTVPPFEGLRLGVIGSSPTLGQWNEVKHLSRTDTYEWGVRLSAADFEEGVEYKYVLTDDAHPGFVLWEKGDNRRIAPSAINGSAAVRSDDAPRFPEEKGWRGAGIVIPVFSLRSEGSQGVGDFGDLHRLVESVPRAGFSAIQLLPVNDTTLTATWRDSYPYNCISVFALHPIYIDMREYAGCKSYAALREQCTRLNVLPALDYEAVFALKMSFLHHLFEEIGTEMMRRPDFRRFVADSEEWLRPYALFCCRKAQEQGRDTSGGEKFYFFVQYLLHRQLTKARDTARRNGVILKGDIPIGISRDSVDAETAPHLFCLDVCAGAPPDAFARMGQNWGFPTYNWSEMKRDGYKWWRQRLEHMSRYFDAFRIDHVLGFFRIWEVPACEWGGLLGHFRPALPLAEEEISTAGFSGDPAYYAEARITAERLSQLKEEAPLCDIHRFLQLAPDGTYVLCPQYATGRAIVDACPEGPLRDALLEIRAEVLFVPDPQQDNMWHPRIGAGETDAFRRLSQADKAAWGHIHDNFFYERHNAFWADHAMEILPALIAAPGADGPAMLPCAEDLGMVPASVKGVLERLKILSLEIQRMPKRYGVRFDDLSQNPYPSVATIATHDMPPLRLWWRENREQTQTFWNDVLHRTGKAPEEADVDICETVVTMHMECPSMLCLLALQDLLAIDSQLRHPHPEEEQINVPANPNQYWRYRMHLTLEQLFTKCGFVEKMRGIIARSGRLSTAADDCKKW